MHKVYETLDVAEETWREVARTEFPLFMDTPVVKAPEDPKNERHWMFYTDGTTTHMDVFQPARIAQHFETRLAPLYQSAYGTSLPPDTTLAERLLHDTLTYLFFHEQFHPTWCPDSEDDKKFIEKALYEGIKKAEPLLSRPNVLRKVGNVRNAAWDQVIDTDCFYETNYGNGLERRLSTVLANAPIPHNAVTHLPDGVIPIFDIMEFDFEQKPFESMCYPLTRAVYGLLFARDHETRAAIVPIFVDRIKKQMQPREIDRVIPEVLKGFVGELSPAQLQFARIDIRQFEQNVDAFYTSYASAQADGTHAALIRDIHTLLIDKRSRYDAIRGFIEPLAKYISLTKEEKRHGTHIGGSGSSDGQSGQNQSGGNTEEALINLANVLGQQEGNALLADVANEGIQGGQAQKDKRLTNLAKDEYYKRNAKEIPIRSPNREAITLDLGKRRTPHLLSTRNIPLEDVQNLPLEAILKFQEETGITQLFQISPYEYRYDEYEWQETEVRDYTFQSTGIDVPANIVFHVDSSGSMGKPDYVGTGLPYDTLQHVCFGILKTVRQAATSVEQPVYVIAANFSNGTIVSKPAELGHMYDTPNNDAKNTLTGFQNGGTDYTATALSDIKKMLHPGKTVHVWITDGELNTSCQQPTLDEITKTIQDPDTTFLYFEIGTASGFGQKIQALSGKNRNIQYYPNVTLEKIKTSTLEVLIQYADAARYTDLI